MREKRFAWILATAIVAAIGLGVDCPARAGSAGYTNGYDLYRIGPRCVYASTRQLNRPLWGLSELAGRTGKPDPALIRQAGGGLTPERTIFRDAAYGTEVWKLTHHSGSTHFYGDVSPWNLNGDVMVIRGGGRGWLMLDPAGQTARPLVLPEPLSISKIPVWDRKDPDVFYCSVAWLAGKPADEQPRGVWRYNFRTGEKTRLYDGLTRIYFESPLSVCGEWMAFKVRGKAAKAAGRRGQGACIARTDGSRLIWLRMGTPHTVRVVGGRVFLFEMEGRFVDRSGGIFATDLTKDTSGSHRTFNWTGTRMASHSWNGFQIVDLRGTLAVNHRVLVTEGKWSSGGHTSWLCDDDEWVFASMGGGKVLGGQLLKIRTDGSGTVHRIAYFNTKGRKGGDYWASPRASVSPDGTKYMFDARTFRAEIFSYVAVVKRPDPPQRVTVRDRTPGKVRIEWAPPYHHKELLGYHVYKSAESGRGFVQVTDAPAAGCEFIDKDLKADGTAYYAVTSVERSGLESSHFSNEVGVTGGRKGYPAAGAVRSFIEAEGPVVKVPLPLREERDVTAAGEECIWHGPGEGAEKAEIFVNYLPPRFGEYYFWARVKSAKAGKLDVRPLEYIGAPKGEKPGQRDGFDVPDTKGKWVWVATRSARPYKFGPMRWPKLRIVAVRSRCPGVKIDRFVWTTDADFTPTGKGNFDQAPPAVPEGLKARFVGAGHVRLSWNAGAEKDFRYYNVYASTDGEVAVAQKHLVLSPSRPFAVDWGIPAGKAVRYAVTAVDRAGNESRPALVEAKP